MDAPRILELSIGPGGHGQRVDAFVSKSAPVLSRNVVQAMLAAGEITVDDRRVKASHKLRTGERVRVPVPPEPAKIPLVRDAVTFGVLFEDEHVLAVDKPPGMTTQPRHRFEGGSLTNAVLTYLGMDGQKGPRIMHRLDRDTSGVVLVAKTDHAAWYIGRQFNAKQIKKEYRALVHGHVARADDLVTMPIGPDPDRNSRHKVNVPGAKTARTRIRRLGSYRDATGLAFSWLAMWPHTGRTHQLRIHATAIGHPMVSDEFYGIPRPPGCTLSRQALHAARILFRHPADQREMAVESPVPADIARELARLVPWVPDGPDPTGDDGRTPDGAHRDSEE